MENLTTTRSCSINYWRNKLKDAPRVCPYIINESGSQISNNKMSLQVTISDVTAENLIKISKNKDLNIFKLFMAGITLVLSRYSFYKDITITSSSFEVSEFNYYDIPGLLFFRMILGEETSVKELMGHIHEEFLECVNNQNGDLVNLKQDVFFDSEFFEIISATGFYYENINAWTEDLNLISLLFKLERNEKQLLFTVNYDASLHNEKAMTLLGSHIVKATEIITEDLNRKLKKINFLTEVDRNLIFTQFNNSKFPYDKTPVITQFELQVNKTPDALATKCGVTELTYRELNRRSNALAHHLLDNHNLQRGDRVAVMVDRSHHILIGILAVLKAGGVFIPIDITSPAERIEYQMIDSECLAVITESHFIKKNQNESKYTLISVEKSYSAKSTNPGKQLGANEVAYFVYTSGTTGKPKGAMIYNSSLSNNVNWFRRTFELSQVDSTMLINSYNFDGSYSYLWAILTSGGTLHIPNKTIFDPDETLEYIEKEKITFLKLVPSTFAVLVNSLTFETNPQACASIKRIQQGGETININNLRKFLNKYPEVKLGNHYGPTETTIGCVAYWITSENIESFAKQPILGVPYDNQQIYITDGQNDLVPVGVFGEICIAGEGVSKGYLNNPKLTSQKYITNPFGSSGKMYKSGDIGRWLPNGTIEFAGRVDNQVKIRGYRVELDAVTESIKEHNDVNDAITLIKNDREDDYLTVWYTSDRLICKTELDDFLKSKLPSFMIPERYIPIERIPLTLNGKVDKTVLLALEHENRSEEKEMVVPKGYVEEGIFKIWQELLGVNDISVTDNFFDIGGHSLKATQLVSRIHKKLNVKLALSEVFANPTITELAKLVTVCENKEEFTEILPIAEQENYPLSHSQKRMWLTHLILEDKTVYNIPHAIRFSSDVDKSMLKEAFRLLVERHESLRTVFISVDGEPKQKVLRIEESEIILQYEDISALKNPFAEALKIAEFEASIVFNLYNVPPHAAKLLRLGNADYVFLFTLHHIISDGWSTSVFTKELLENYSRLSRGISVDVDPLKIQYKDFVNWQNEFFNSNHFKKQKEYWKQEFSGELSTLELPTDFSRPLESSHRGKTKSHVFSEEIANKIQFTRTSYGATAFMIFLTGLKSLLHRYTNQQDIIIGTPVAGREHADLNNQIGFYANTLAIRSQISGELTFLQALDQVRNNLIKAYHHQAYPFDMLIEDLDIQYEKGHSPLFNVMAVMQNNEDVHQEKFELNGLSISDFQTEHKTSKYDITFSFHKKNKTFSMEIEYSIDLFSDSKIERMILHFETLLNNMLDHENKKINTHNYLSQSEQKQLNHFSERDSRVLPCESIPEQFSNMVSIYTHSTALVDETCSYTYKQLDFESNRIAFKLKEEGIKKGDIVAITEIRSAHFVICLLGILKAGAAYLPLDNKAPIDRILSLLKLTEAKVVITDNDEMLNNLKDCFTCLDIFNLDNLKIKNKIEIPIKIESDTLAYVMFTSGTTGSPKGVMVTHNNILNLISETNYTILSPVDRILQAGSLSFDAATFEIWGALLHGGQLHMNTLENLLDINTLKKDIREKEITKMVFTTSWFNQLADLDAHIFNSLDQVLVGGEKLSPAHIKKVKEACPKLKITNGYGPTENTTFSICGDVLDEDIDQIKLGRPITGSTVHILDANLMPVPVGITGEIYLGGAGVSKGYINDAALTKCKFIESPFTTGEILYKSGDLGRWHEDGRVLFCGRTDEQVKIRGHRIEPAEIQTVMLDHPSIKETEVLITENNKKEKVIVSYYTVSQTLETAKIKEYLKEKLPGYMIPEYFMVLGAMPLNKNGKVDRKNLPRPDFSKVNSGIFITPESKTEERLRDCFGRALKLEADTISITESFFDLGGHSLKALQLLKLIELEFKVTLKISSIFSEPTVKALAAVIEISEKSNTASLIKAPRKLELYPVTAVQHRLYALYHKNPESLAYNVPGTLKLPLKYSVKDIEKACRELIKRHKILRTSFLMKDQEVFQKVHPTPPFGLEIIDSADSESALESFIEPFDLEKAPLIRVGLVKTTYCNWLLMDFHHIVIDGLSQTILTKELYQLLEGRTQEALAFQYKDYAWWINQTVQQEDLKKQEAYWLKRYANPLPKLELPTDYTRPAIRNYRGGTAQFVISEENTQFLRSLSREQGTTLYMNLISFWALLLAKIGDVDDVAVGTPVSGRRLPEVSQMVGMFVNTLAIRVFPKGELSFLKFLQKVKQNILIDLERQEYPFEELIEKISIERNTAENPIFNTMFSLLTKEEFDLEVANTKEQLVFSEKPTGVKFDMNFKVADLNDQIICNLDYSSELFSKDTIRSMVHRFNMLLDQTRMKPEINIRSLSIVSKDEKDQLAAINNTGVASENDFKTIDQFFDEKASKYPEKLGVADSKGFLSIKEVQNKASKIANAITRNQIGLGNNKLVGIMLPARKEIAVAILGIFKAGAAYVPIDTDLPSERINHILMDSEIEFLISAPEVAKSINFSGQLLDVDEIMDSESFEDEFVSRNHHENIAYIIYTSGSTGKPKGVPIKQHQLVNYVNWFTNKLSYTHEDSSVLVSSYAYDLGHSNIFPAMANGGALHILKKEEYLSTVFLGNYIRENKVSFIKTTPTLFNVFINDPNYDKNYMSSLKRLILGGETIIAKDVEKFFEYYPDKYVVNHYGPTEATIGCVAKIITSEDWKAFKELPVIGRPINNMQVHILDTDLNTVPKGAVGQIYLSGIGVSVGYHKRQKLSTEKFIKNPFNDSEKMYATGDLGFWSNNYEVVFKGRADHQIKVRGYRVELDGIASVLRSVDGVTSAVVITAGDENDKMIVAYVETSKEISELYEELKALLPAYMIPSVIIPVSEIPITPNGKTDMRVLKAIPIPALGSQNSEAPVNEREKQLMELWGNILKVPVRDTKADFFRLGGHSLKALKVVNYIEQHWHLKVPLKVFFENPTIKGLAEKLKYIKQSTYERIEPVSIQDNYPLSHAQQRLWLLNELSENQVAYNIPRVFRLKGPVNETIIRQVFDMLVKRHEVLRTVFRQLEGTPRQVIIDAENFKGYFVSDDIAHLDEKKVLTLVSDLVNYAFDLEKGPLLKITLLKESEGVYLLVINLHHIISDGWSAGIMLKELCEGYNNSFVNAPIVGEALRIQYKDFAVWQNKKMANQEYLEKQSNFWKTKLSGELNRCTLAESFSRSSNQKTVGKTITHIMGKNIANKLEQLAIEEQSSLYMVLLSALNIVLYRYTGLDDIILGTVIAGREREELSNQLGFYVNTLVQRTRLNYDDSFVDVLNKVKDDVLATAEHQYYPFDLVVSDLGLVKEEGRSPLFDIMFVHQNNEDVQDYQLALEGISVVEVAEDLNESKFDVSFVSRKIGDDLQIFVEYDTKIYSERFLKEFLNNFENLLHTLVNQKDERISKTIYLGDSSRDMLAGFNATYKHKTYTNIQSHFEKTVVERGEDFAVITQKSSLTYEELNEKANQMAWWLRDTHNSLNNRLIAFCLERSEWQLISMLAILKSGAGFLPIDTKQPAKRKDFIIQDANPVMVITDQPHWQTNKEVSIETIESICDEISSYPKTNLEHKNKPEDLAYAIYTSGSTGKPKGVMISHKGNINMITDQVRRFQIGPTDRCLQFASISFDASVYEIFIALYAGASVVLLTQEIIADPKIFIQYLEEKGVTFATLPPVYLSGLEKEALTRLRVLVTAGESPNLKDAQYFSKHLNYYNAYGPTEYSVCASVYKVKGDERVIPIGEPLDNTAMYILDEAMNLLPVGCWGELYLSGTGTALGYINNADENEKRFLDNPFDRENKLYKTGDIARWNADGYVEFKGRKDDMLKIRGYRIEVAEIEQAIMECAQIEEVVIHFDRERQILIAYIIANDIVTEIELKSFLRDRLPGYMIPSIYSFLERIPLTTNGKVDHQALSVLSKDTVESREIALPENEMEKTLLTLWSELLNKDESYISTNDNFFDYGGHSILAMKLTNKIWETYHKDISIRDFLKTPTIKGLVVQLKLKEKDKGLLMSLNQVEQMEKELFMIPPVLGSSSVFRSLASHFEKQGVACYGVQYRGFDYDDDFDESIEQMALSGIEEIRKFLTHEKPVFIAGYSMGALIAAEITSKLENEGFKVSLILIDKTLDDSMGELHGANFDQHKNELPDLFLKEHMQGFEIPNHNLNRIKNLLKHNIYLLEKYKFNRALKSDILAIEAKESGKKGKMSSWDKVTDGTLFHMESAGDHFTIIDEANSYQLYKSISRFINRNIN